jgi:hypothetical protein
MIGKSRGDTKSSKTGKQTAAIIDALFQPQKILAAVLFCSLVCRKMS